MKESKTYSQEFKDKLVQEYKDTGSLSEVARKNSVPVTTLRQWVINKSPKRAPKIDKRQLESLQKELDKKTIEVEILKELLKKTNQAWLND